VVLGISARGRQYKPAPQCKGLLPVAEKAQGTQILKVALSSAFHHGQDMIGIPESLAREPLEPPSGQKPLPMCATRAPQFPVGSAGVDPADRANAPVPLQNLLAKITGVGTEAPFVDTPIRTERKAPHWDFQATPTAERPAVAPSRQSGAIGEAARHCPGDTQDRHNIFSIKCLRPSRKVGSCPNLALAEFLAPIVAATNRDNTIDASRSLRFRT
jgi:hypothetical protein